MAQYDLELFGNKLIIDDMIDAAIQELDILFGTEETELLGDFTYGVNFEQFLWKLNPSIGEVNSYIKDKILEFTTFCRVLNISVDTAIEMGTIRDIYVVKIEIKDENNKTVKLKNWIFK